MHVATPAVKSRFRWMARMLALALLPAMAWAQAPIQITPLPEARPATVTQLGAADLGVRDVQVWLDGEMDAVMHKSASSGAVAVVVKDGEILYAKGYGVADTATNKPVEPATSMFRAASLSELFTWTSVMQLVEKHKLDLDADINRYLDFIVPPRDGKPVTLRDLMTHTAGFEDVIKDRYAYSAAALLPYDTWVKRWVPARIYAEGSVPAYSSYGAALAGYIVQRASGQPFNDYVERHILEPLEMKHASFRQPLPANLQDDMLPGYGAPNAAPRPFDLRTAVPANALSVSGEDMARFMIAYLQYGRSGNAQLLEQATVQAMQGYQRAAIPGLPGMALGFARMDRDGQTVLGRAGDFGGFHSLLVLYPDHHTGVFIATRGGDASPLLQPLTERFSARYFPPLPQIKPATLATGKQHAAQLAGRYVPSITSQSNVIALRDLFTDAVTVTAPGGVLHVPVLADARWREVAPYLWLDDATGRRLGAVVRDGRVSMWSIDSLSPTQVFLPASGWTAEQVSLFLVVVLGVFAALALSWPIAALLRHRIAAAQMTERDARWYRLSRLTAGLYLLFAGGWCLLLPRLGIPGTDMRMRLLHMVGILAVLGTVPVAVETWRAWRSGGWWRRIGGSILLLACLAAMAFMAHWHLLDPSLGY